VKDSEPLVPEDRERWERNRLLAEEQKQNKDATKRTRGKTLRTREALEKHRRQQERDGLPQEESPSEPDSDDGDLDIFWMRSKALGTRYPHKVLPPVDLRGARCSRKRGQGPGPLAPAR
jgi:hypothetical protein